MSSITRGDIYSRVTDKIVADLEKGVRPWLKPWNAEHAAGRITRPLRGNGEPYKGINILMLWGEAELKGYNCPIWITYRQAHEALLLPVRFELVLGCRRSDGLRRRLLQRSDFARSPRRRAVLTANALGRVSILVRNRQSLVVALFAVSTHSSANHPRRVSAGRNG